MNSNWSSSSSVACIATEYFPSINGVISMLMNCRGCVTGAAAPATVSRDIVISVLLRRAPRNSGSGAYNGDLEDYTPVRLVDKKRTATPVFTTGDASYFGYGTNAELKRCLCLHMPWWIGNTDRTAGTANQA